VVVVVVIVFMLVVHGRWCIIFIFIEAEALEASFEMAVLFPFKGSKGWEGSTRTRTNTNPYDTKANTLGEFCVPELHG
jgi:hypothetical protein